MLPDRVVLPPGRSGETAEFPVRAVSPVQIASRFRRSALELAPLFQGDEVLRARLGKIDWYFGRSPEWTRHVIGSRALWADLDALPLGLRRHPTYYAMGGLPGAPPDVHRRVRRTAVASGFGRGPVDRSTVDDALGRATAMALDPRTRLLDLRTFARALFFQVTAVSVAGLCVDDSATAQILDWFTQWSSLVSNPLTMVGQPWLPFMPAKRFHDVLAQWYGYLVEVLNGDAPAPGALVSVLRDQLSRGEIEIQEAAGYLATILFAGTEPPAHTLLWAHAFCVATPPDQLGDVDRSRAEALLWEAFRVQPAVNVLVRRRSAGPGEYRSASTDVFVVAPPLSHHRANVARGLPLSFSPSSASETHFDSDEYPGLGTGAHFCIGARLGMEVATDALRFLLAETTVLEPPDLRCSGVITTEPRRVPVVRLSGG